jgi:hypothetical protein
VIKLLTKCHQNDKIKDNWLGIWCALVVGKAYQVLVGKHERKRSVGKPRHGWEENIKINLKVFGRMWAVLNTAMNLLSSIKFLR